MTMTISITTVVTLAVVAVTVAFMARGSRERVHHRRRDERWAAGSCGVTQKPPPLAPRPRSERSVMACPEIATAQVVRD